MVTNATQNDKAMSNGGVDATSGYLSKTIDDTFRGANAKSAILSSSPHNHHAITTLNNTSGLTLHE